MREQYGNSMHKAPPVQLSHIRLSLRHHQSMEQSYHTPWWGQRDNMRWRSPRARHIPFRIIFICYVRDTTIMDHGERERGQERIVQVPCRKSTTQDKHERIVRGEWYLLSLQLRFRVCCSFRYSTITHHLSASPRRLLPLLSLTLDFGLKRRTLAAAAWRGRWRHGRRRDRHIACPDTRSRYRAARS